MQGQQPQRWEIRFHWGRGLRQVSEKASRAHGCWLRLIPLTVALLAIFYSPSLNEGETETLQNIRGDQLYQNLIHGQMMVGAFTRVNSTVIEGDYVPEYELREIARQNGTVRTRVRFRIEEDPESGELVSRSYEVGGKKWVGSGPGAVCKTAG